MAELFSPYRPEDFNGFIDEYMLKRLNESVIKPKKLQSHLITRMWGVGLSLFVSLIALTKIIVA